jgi:hypothetical protein
MKVGIGLPTTIAGVQPEQVLEWARRSEQAGFSRQVDLLAGAVL